MKPPTRYELPQRYSKEERMRIINKLMAEGKSNVEIGLLMGDVSAGCIEYHHKRYNLGIYKKKKSKEWESVTNISQDESDNIARDEFAKIIAPVIVSAIMQGVPDSTPEQAVQLQKAVGMWVYSISDSIVEARKKWHKKS